jgi:hypothetical protein
MSPSLTSRPDDGFSRNVVRTERPWRPPQYYISSGDQTHNIYEVGVVTESITTLRLYIVTDLRKVGKFFKAISCWIQINMAALREFSLTVGMMVIISWS